MVLTHHKSTLHCLNVVRTKFKKIVLIFCKNALARKGFFKKMMLMVIYLFSRGTRNFCGVMISFIDGLNYNVKVKNGIKLKLRGKYSS